MAMVFAQEWEESERGWGVRPDGFWLYPSTRAVHEGTDLKIKQQTEICNEIYGKGVVPSEYSRTCGVPFALEVNQETFDKVHKDGSLWVRSIKDLQIPNSKTIALKGSAELHRIMKDEQKMIPPASPELEMRFPNTMKRLNGKALQKKLGEMSKKELVDLIKDATTELSKR